MKKINFNVCKPLFAGLLLCILFMHSNVLFAQDAAADNAVTGRVLDEKGVPVSGCVVVLKGTTTGTTADVDGFFLCNATCRCKEW